MTKKRYGILGVTVLALALMIGPAQSAMWFGGQLGGNIVADSDVTVRGPFNGSLTAKNLSFDTSVIGGVILGYDFVKEGFLGYNYPSWMRYFSFAIDFTYNNSNTRQQSRSASFVAPGVNLRGGVILNQADISQATLTFLFMFKYGFLPDPEVPFGRVVPYIGVGPGIVFSSLDSPSFVRVAGFAVPLAGGSDSSADIALVAEAGIRFMALKNVSIDTVFRYRWCQPSYSFGRGIFANSINVDVDNLHQFSLMLRANIHF